jgi:hypothetical protein
MYCFKELGILFFITQSTPWKGEAASVGSNDGRSKVFGIVLEFPHGL